MEILGFRIERIKTSPPLQAKAARPPKHSKRSRLTHEDPYTAGAWGLAQMFTYQAPEDANEFWRRNDLDTQTLRQMSAAELAEYMVDLSPEISKAVWDLQRFCNPGWEARAMNGDEPDEAGQVLLDSFIAELDDMHGSVSVPIGRLFMAAFVRGSFLAEIVLDENARMPVDLATPDPYIVRFRKVVDPVRGQIWEIGQQKSGEFDSLKGIPTIRYIPIDPFPGKPYGRSLLTPAFFSSLFLIGLLHDLRRVVAQQGYPRLDLEVKLEQLMSSMPTEYQNDPDKMREWINDTINEVATLYAQLEPDDAYIHTDVVSVNRPVGAMSNSTTFTAFDSLIQAIERVATRALKSIPLLMGLDRSSNETNSNREWELYVAGIKSLQHHAETILSRLFTIALQVQGSTATVKFKFAELRASEMLRDAMTEQVIINNARAKYDHGWISQDTAAEEATGTAADVDAPRDSGGDSGGMDFDPALPLDGEERKRRITELRQLHNEVLSEIKERANRSSFNGEVK